MHFGFLKKWQSEELAPVELVGSADWLLQEVVKATMGLGVVTYFLCLAEDLCLGQSQFQCLKQTQIIKKLPKINYKEQGQTKNPKHFTAGLKKIAHKSVV